MSSPVPGSDPATERYTPRVTVAAVVQHRGRFLIVEEWVNGDAVFNQPAGHLEPGESLLEALRRETLEESGCEIEPQHLINIYHTDTAQPERTKLRFNFAARLITQHAGMPLDTGIIATHWLTPEQLQGHSDRLRSPVVTRCVEDFQAGCRLPLSVLREVHT